MKPRGPGALADSQYRPGAAPYPAPPDFASNNLELALGGAGGGPKDAATGCAPDLQTPPGKSRGGRERRAEVPLPGRRQKAGDRRIRAFRT